MIDRGVWTPGNLYLDTVGAVNNTQLRNVSTVILSIQLPSLSLNSRTVNLDKGYVAFKFAQYFALSSNQLELLRSFQQFDLANV